MNSEKTPTNCAFCGKEIPFKGNSYNHKFCNNQCQGSFRANEWLKNNKDLFEKGLLKGRGAIKKYIYLRDGNKCSICGQLPEHNGKSLTMVLDHIDGDATNNLPYNFRLVCPDCDSQLPTFKARNRGNGRATKGMKWYSQL
jgi:endogenous inhibitor of DNA gyrase (YacG/DUF329 family)